MYSSIVNNDLSVVVCNFREDRWGKNKVPLSQELIFRFKGTKQKCIYTPEQATLVHCGNYVRLYFYLVFPPNYSNAISFTAFQLVGQANPHLI